MYPALQTFNSLFSTLISFPSTLTVSPLCSMLNVFHYVHRHSGTRPVTVKPGVPNPFPARLAGTSTPLGASRRVGWGGVTVWVWLRGSCRFLSLPSSRHLYAFLFSSIFLLLCSLFYCLSVSQKWKLLVLAPLLMLFITLVSLPANHYPQ